MEMRRAALIAEGLPANEVEHIMGAEAVSGGAGGGRQNALATLVAMGARVEATAGGQDAEHARLQERKRLQRSVDAFLQKHQGVEKFQTDGVEVHAREKLGVRIRSAHEVARETEITRVGGTAFARSVANLERAREARDRYRQWMRSTEGHAFLEQAELVEGEGEEVLELDEGDEREMQLGQGVAENGAADEVEEDANDDDDASEMSAA